MTDTIVFKISCLTVGDYIKIPSELAYSIKNMRYVDASYKDIYFSLSSSMKSLITNYWKAPYDWGYLGFKTEEAAKWFISHKLVYNSRRTNPEKLRFMGSLLEYNGLSADCKTLKLEFEVVSTVETL